LFVTLFPTRLFERVQYSLITSSQPITIEPLTNKPKQIKLTKKERTLPIFVCPSHDILTSNILKVNFDKLRVSELERNVMHGKAGK